MTNERIDTLKVKLIARISAISNEEMLHKLEEILSADASADPTDLLHRLVRPMPSKLDIETLIVKQGFRGVDRSKFDKLVKKINIQEPLNQLLANI
jgi:hypothetical protein